MHQPEQYVVTLQCGLRLFAGMMVAINATSIRVTASVNNSVP